MRENQTSQKEKAECAHEWKAIEETHRGTHVELTRIKCGKTKEIELFP